MSLQLAAAVRKSFGSREDCLMDLRASRLYASG